MIEDLIVIDVFDAMIEHLFVLKMLIMPIVEKLPNHFAGNNLFVAKNCSLF